MNAPSTIEYLSNHAFFGGLSAETLSFLCNCCSRVEIAKGHVLFHQGETADKFYVLLSGNISIEMPAILGPSLVIQSLRTRSSLGLVLADIAL